MAFLSGICIIDTYYPTTPIPLFQDAMQLTQFTDYGLRSLMYLAAQPDRFSSVREISDHFGISRNHLVKVVHRLAQLGYLNSTKGKGRGIRLAHDPNPSG
jgi:Rrf2 family transcriptional regulator, nitric oxide-sensitive transcriptional repressor